MPFGYFTLLYFNHFLNRNTYIYKAEGKAKNRNKFPYKWPPKPQKKPTSSYRRLIRPIFSATSVKRMQGARKIGLIVIIAGLTLMKYS